MTCVLLYALIVGVVAAIACSEFLGCVVFDFDMTINLISDFFGDREAVN